MPEGREITRVLLVNPPSPERLGGPLVGLQYVASALLAHGSEVRVIDAAARAFSAGPEWIAAEAERFAPHLVGMPLYTRWIRHAYRLAELLRDQSPLLVAGGPHATACPAEVLRHGFDIVVSGEAESTITALADHVAGRARLERIRGIRFLDSAGNLAGSAATVHAHDLDALPFPLASRPLFDPTWYGYTQWPTVSNGILSSRGCPARCTFCANQATGRVYRFRSAGSVVSEMRASWALWGTDFFPFWDDALTADQGDVRRLCAAIERDLPFSPRWIATTRVNAIGPGLLPAMKRAGLAALNFGVESGDDETLRSIRKGIRTTQVVRALELARNAGLRTSCSFMFGFPGESPAALEHTLRFMEQISPLVDAFATAGVLVPMPGTSIYEEHHERFGFTDWWLRDEDSRWPARPEAAGFEEVARGYTRDPVLDLDFFHYPPHIRALIQACLDFTAGHNLRRMREGAAIPETGSIP